MYFQMTISTLAASLLATAAYAAPARGAAPADDLSATLLQRFGDQVISKFS